MVPHWFGSGAVLALGRMSSLYEKLAQPFELLVTQVAELFEVQPIHLGAELIEQPTARRQQPDVNDAPVLTARLALDVAELDQAIHEPRDVRPAGHEVLADGLAGHALVTVAGDDSKRVVEGRRESRLVEKPLERAVEDAGGAQDVEERLLLGGGVGGALAQFLGDGLGAAAATARFGRFG